MPINFKEIKMCINLFFFFARGWVCKIKTCMISLTFKNLLCLQAKRFSASMGRSKWMFIYPCSQNDILNISFKYFISSMIFSQYFRTIHHCPNNKGSINRCHQWMGNNSYFLLLIPLTFYNTKIDNPSIVKSYEYYR